MSGKESPAKEYTSVTCPNCGTDNKTVIWQCLNADLEPEAKQELLNGNFFRVTCKKCGKTHMLNYPLLYHDMTHSAFVYYANSENSLNNVFKSIKETSALDIEQLDSYKTRIVTSQHVLREKAIIFDNDLDDRVIEVIKLFYLDKALEKHPQLDITEVIFHIVGDKQYLQFITSTPLTTEVDKTLYSQIAADIAEIIKKPEFDSYFIDLDWAYSVLETLN